MQPFHSFSLFSFKASANLPANNVEPDHGFTAHGTEKSSIGNVSARYGDPHLASNLQ